jgi:hypothetical protein
MVSRKKKKETGNQRSNSESRKNRLVMAQLSSADFTKSFGDTLWRFGARIHPLKVSLLLRKVVDQVELVGPIDKIRGDAIQRP